MPGFGAPQLPQQTQLVGAKRPAGISSQPSLTPLHCILCTWNGFQFFRHPAFPACISAVCFQRRIVAIVCRAVGKSTPCFHPHSTPTPSWGQNHPAFSRSLQRGYSPASPCLHPTLGPLDWTRKELFVLLQTSLHRQNPCQGCDLPGASTPDLPGSPGCSRSPLRCHQNPRSSQPSALTWLHTVAEPFLLQSLLKPNCVTAHMLLVNGLGQKMPMSASVEDDL